MALKPVSRNAFAALGQPSLADLIARVGAASDLPKTTRQNWCWALRTVARVAGKAPAAIPAHPEFLRRLMGKAAPGSMGLGIGAWNNAKSLTGKAMTWAGLISIPGHYQAPYTPEWSTLWLRLPPKSALAVQLTRLFHYCSANGLQPEDVNDEVLQQFYEALTEESLVENPYEAYRGRGEELEQRDGADSPDGPAGPVSRAVEARRALLACSGPPSRETSASRSRPTWHLWRASTSTATSPAPCARQRSSSGASSCCGSPAPSSTAAFRLRRSIGWRCCSPRRWRSAASSICWTVVVARPIPPSPALPSSSLPSPGGSGFQPRRSTSSSATSEP